MNTISDSKCDQLGIRTTKFDLSLRNYYTEGNVNRQPLHKKKHALWKMIQRRFVSVFSVEEYVLEQENKNNITFKWKFLSNFTLFVALFMRNKFVYQIPLGERNLNSCIYITASKILDIIVHP